MMVFVGARLAVVASLVAGATALLPAGAPAAAAPAPAPLSSITSAPAKPPRTADKTARRSAPVRIGHSAPLAARSGGLAASSIPTPVPPRGSGPPPPPPAPARVTGATPAVLLVNVATDAPDDEPDDSVCDADQTTDGSQCSLRAALATASELGGAAITFSVAMTIPVGTPLPVVSVPVTLDGTTVPGYGGTTRVVVRRSAGAPVMHGLHLSGPGSVVRGLEVSGFGGILAVTGPTTYEPAAAVLTDGAGAVVSASVFTGNRVGVWATGPDTQIGAATGERNVFVRNLDSAIIVSTAAAVNVRVQRNDIGVREGTPIGTDGSGVVLDGDGTDGGPSGTVVTDNTVVGVRRATTGPMAFRRAGLGVVAAATTSSRITSNRIGTVDGLAAAGNVRGVVLVDTVDAAVGGSTTAEANLVAASTEVGVEVSGAGTGTRVWGNRIGTDATGTSALGNATGVSLLPGGARAGPDDTSLQRNLISGNTGVGIEVVRSSHTTIEDSVVGLDAASQIALPNQGEGIVIASSTDTVIRRSTISGNGRAGILAHGTAGPATTTTTITGNTIGTNAADAALGNQWGVAVLDNTNGVVVGARRGEQVASPCPQCNVIAHNARSGVQVQDDTTVPGTAAAVTIRANSLHDNGTLPIDLVTWDGGDAPRAADSVDLPSRNGTTHLLDADHGANESVNAPVAVLGVVRPVQRGLGLPMARHTGETAVSGRVLTPDPELTTVDVYGLRPADAPANDPVASYGGARTWLGEAVVRADGSFSATVPTSLVTQARLVGATVTDAAGNTSELSATCRPVTPGRAPDEDADALCDSWETASGFDVDRDGHPDLDLRALGASPDKRDLFVENDQMSVAPSASIAGIPRPDQASLLQVQKAFAQAPQAPIALHTNTSPLDTAGHHTADPWRDETISEGSVAAAGAGAPGEVTGARIMRLRDGTPAMPCDGFFGRPADRAALTGEPETSSSPTCAKRLLARAMVYRWSLWGGWYARVNSSSGIAWLGGPAFAVTVGNWDRATLTKFAGRECAGRVTICRAQIAGATFMHELGHTLGLIHGGDSNQLYKPNYLSVMNYAFQLGDVFPQRPLDYSGFALDPLDQDRLVEADGLAQPGPPQVSARWTTTVQAVDVNGVCTPVPVPIGPPIDWNRDGVTASTPVRRALTSCAGSTGSGTGYQVLNGFDDWANLDFDHRWPEMTEQQFRTEVGGLSEADALSHARHADADGDGVVNLEDVCPSTSDPDQRDRDGDGIGDACVEEITTRDLTLAASAAVSAPVGSTASVRVSLANHYPLDASRITVGLDLPDGVSLVSATPTTGSMSGPTWTVPQLSARTSAYLDLELRVTTTGRHALRAEVDTAGEPDLTSTPGNDAPWEDDQASVTVTGTALAGAAPAVQALTATSAAQFRTWTATTTFTDADSTAWTATADYGDGPQPVTVDLANRRVSLSRTFTGVAPPSVVVCVTDSGGRRGCRTTALTLTPAAPTTTVPVAVRTGSVVPAVAVAQPGQTLSFTRSDGRTNAVRATSGRFDSGAWPPSGGFSLAAPEPGLLTYDRVGAPMAGPAGVLTACPTDDGLDSQESAFAGLLAEYRMSQGLAPLAISRTATRAALAQARDNAATGVLSHLGSDGSDPGTRMAAAGYRGDSGENLLAGRSAATAALAAWRASPGHDANLRDPRWRAVGIARTLAADGTWFWATTFGTVDDCPAEPVVAPAFTLDATSPVTGASVTFTNRSRGASGVPFAATVRDSPAGTPRTVGPGATTTFAYPSVGARTVTAAVGTASARALVDVRSSAVAATLTWTGPTTVTAGGTLTGDAVLTRSGGGAPVAGVVVTAAVASASANATTSPDGHATLSLAAPAASGPVTLTLSSPATAEVFAASASVPLTVTPAPAYAAAYRGPRWLTTQRSSLLATRVTDPATGAPVTGRTVRASIGGVSATAATGADGIARPALAPIASGAQTLRVEVLSGGPGTAVVASSEVPVSVLAPGTSRLVAGYGAGPYDASLSHVDPGGVVARNGIVYVADRISGSVLRVDTTVSPRRATTVVPASALGSVPVGFRDPVEVGLALDASGRLYVADVGGHQVLRYDPATGSLTRIAGTGTAGFSGDGGPATAAALDSPRGVAVDAAGRVFIADTGNRRVRMIAGGTISTVLGAGAPGAAGAASLVRPVTPVVPSGATVAVMDLGANAVVSLNTDGTVTTPVRGDSIAPLGGVAVDTTGALVTTTGEDLTRTTSAGSAVLFTTTLERGANFTAGSFGRAPRLIGEGSAPGSGLASLSSLTFDGPDLLFVQRTTWVSLRRITGFGGSGAAVDTIAGGPFEGFAGVEGARATSVQLGEPTGVVVAPDGGTWISDARAYRTYRVDPDGAIAFSIGNPSSQSATCDNSHSSGTLRVEAQLLCAPGDVTLDPQGRPVLLDSGHGEVLVRADSFGSTLSLLAGTYRDRSQTGEGVRAVYASLQDAQGIAYGPDGRLLVVDTSRNRIRRLDPGSPDWVVNTIAGTGSPGFSGDGGPASAAQFSRPSDVAYDTAGNLYVADTGNHRVRRIDGNTGVVTTVAGTGTAGFSGDGGPATAAALNAPSDVLVVGTTLVIADRLNHRIRMVDLTTGRISTIAGTGSTGREGLGGPAAALAVPWPQHLASDGGGTVLVTSGRGGSLNGLGLWSSGAGTGAVLRIALPSGR